MAADIPYRILKLKDGDGMSLLLPGRAAWGFFLRRVDFASWGIIDGGRIDGAALRRGEWADMPFGIGKLRWGKVTAAAIRIHYHLSEGVEMKVTRHRTQFEKKLPRGLDKANFNGKIRVETGRGRN